MAMTQPVQEIEQALAEIPMLDVHGASVSGPTLPATTITLSVMANAHRIGTAAVK